MPDKVFLKVLSVLVVYGNFSQKINIAVAMDEPPLFAELAKWLNKNRERYAGKYFIDNIPYCE